METFTMRSLGVLLVAFVGLAAVQGCGRKGYVKGLDLGYSRSQAVERRAARPP